MIASLGMYARPEITQHNDALWAAIRAELGYGPQNLNRQTDLGEIWKDPNLLLAQTCGLPFRRHLSTIVQLVGTFDYGVQGCPQGHYNSVFVTRLGDDTELAAYRTRKFVYNDANSQSGWAAAQTHMGVIGGSFRNSFASGSHHASARAVADRRADIASLDAVSWRLLQQYEPFAAQLQVVDVTGPTPSLPLITAKGNDAAAIFDAVQAAIAKIDTLHLEKLGIRGIVSIPERDYLAIPVPRDPTEPQSP